jgi:hypothetical protein
MFPLTEHPELYVGTSIIHGIGLFSKVDFSEDDVVFAMRGSCTSESYDKNYEVGPTWISVGLNRWLIPHPCSPGRFLNHSCESNSRLCDDFAIRALQRILAGTEILIDYSTTELDPHWQMACQCHASSCRGIVKPFYQIFEPSRQKVLSATPRKLRRLAKIAAATAVAAAPRASRAAPTCSI